MSNTVDPRLLYGKDVWKEIMGDVRETISFLSGQRRVGRLGSSVTPILTMLPILPAGQSRCPALWADYSSHVDAQCSQSIGKANQLWMKKLITFHLGNR